MVDEVIRDEITAWTVYHAVAFISIAILAYLVGFTHGYMNGKNDGNDNGRK